MTTRRMRSAGSVLGAVVAASLLLSGLAGPAAAKGGGRPFRLALSGAEEFGPTGAPINPHGDADRGSIELRLNHGQRQVCWSVGPITLASGDALPHVAHIHRAPAGVAGPVVIDLFGTSRTPPAPTSYPTGRTCVTAAKELIREVMDNPSAYYVNLHNAQHPAGVMRAQLAR